MSHLRPILGLGAFVFVALLACAGAGSDPAAPAAPSELKVPAPTSTSTTPGADMSDAKELLEQTWTEGVAKHGVPKLGRDELSDTPVFRAHFTLADALSKATGLDFMKLAGAQRFGGMRELEKIASALPAGPSRDQATTLIDRVRAVSGQAPKLTWLYGELRDPSLSGVDQLHAYIDGLLDALKLLEGKGELAMPRLLTRYQGAIACAELTGIDRDKLVLLAHSSNARHFKQFLELMPDLPQRDACLAAL